MKAYFTPNLRSFLSVAFLLSFFPFLHQPEDLCTDPVILGVSSSGDLCAAGQAATLTVDGTLHDASDWYWYADACGNTFVGTGASIVVTPAQTTTYFVRGEPACGDPLDCVSIVVEVGDALPPVLSIPPDVTLACGDPVAPPSQTCAPLLILRETLVFSLNANGAATAHAADWNLGSVDPCNTSGLSFSFSPVSSDNSRNLGCNDLGMKTFTIWATDGNGNQSKATVSALVEEPNGNCPPSGGNCVPEARALAMVAAALPPAGALTVQASAFDHGSINGCTAGNPVFSFSSDLNDLTRTFDCSALGDQPLSFWASGDPASQTHVSVTLQVQDNLSNCPSGSGCAPVPVVLGAITVDLPPSKQLTLTASLFDVASEDLCSTGGLQFSFSNDPGDDHLTVDCSHLGSQTLEIWVTDDVGNQNFASVTLIVQDTQDDCAGPGFAWASDDCDPAPVVTYSDATAAGICPVATTITRTWTATDAVGNAVSLDQILTIEDTEAPSITCPDDQVDVLDANCSFVLPDYTSLITASDDCNGPLGVSQAPLAGTSVNSATLIELTVTDPCGQSTTCTFQLELSDGTPPLVQCPQDQSVAVDANCSYLLPDFTGAATASDNCDQNLFWQQTPAAGESVSESTLITLAATDASGNTGDCSFTLTVENAAPVFSILPSDITVSCAADVPGSQNVQALDDCDGLLPVTFIQSALPVACPGSGVVTNTWSATDSDGHTTTHVQTVMVEDNIAPVLSAMPQDITVDCLGQAPGDPGITAVDNCDEPISVIFMQSPGPDCPGAGSVTNTWVAQDCSGNSVTWTQVVTIDNDVPPVFSETPPSITVSCLADVPGHQNIFATDVCGNLVEVIFTQTGDPACVGVGEIVNSWVATDCAGNTSAHTQVVTIEDTEAPVLSAFPQDKTVKCVQDVPGDPGITAVDNCGESVSVAYMQSAPPSCSGDGVMTNTWTATDCAGNTIVHIQTITIEDLTAPVFSSQPANITVSCLYEVPGNPGITAFDNCDGQVPVSFTQSPPPACSGSGLMTNTWTASDCAGNVTTYVQIVTIQDVSAPVFSGTPGNLTVACLDNVPGDPGITAFDACQGPVVVSFSQSPLPACSGSGVVTNTWTASDCAGNTATHVQTITIEDNTPPVLSAQPAPLTVTCAADIPGDPGIVAMDNCGAPITVVFTQTGLPLACPGNGTVTNTWTATDCSGNTTAYSQVVTVEDETPPVLSAYPAHLTVACEDEIPGNPGITAFDNCFGPLTVAFTQTGMPPVYPDPDPVVNTWIATDCAGNAYTHTQVVTLDDPIPPVAIAKNITISLDGAGQASIDPGMIDNGSWDNCAITQYSLSKSNFSCVHVGVNPVQLTVTDAFGNTASAMALVSVVASGACASPAIAYAGGPNISDPCSCRGNGAFDEEVVVGPAGIGQDWSVVTTDLLHPITLTPIPPGTALVEVPYGPGQSIYTIKGVHLDGVGYTIEVESPFYPGQTLSISNTCYYPEPEIIGLDGPFCLLSPPVTLEGSVGGVYLESQTFFIDGIPASVFHPGQLGVGSHQVTYTVDAGLAAPGDPADPGCVSTVSEMVHIVSTPAVIACNTNIQVSVDQDCEALITPDMILEGSYPCYDDYSVTVKLGINTLPNPVPGTYIGQTLTVTVKHLISGNSCWGTITLADALKPQFNCPTAPVTISCTQDYTILPSPVAYDNCTPVTYQLVNESIVDTDVCDDGKVRIERSWKATDNYGNESDICVQVIEIERPDDVDFPNDIAWECDQYDVYPGILNPQPLHPSVKALENGVNPINATQIASTNILNATGSGIPLYIDGQYCNYAYSHADQIIGGCGSTFTIVRTWTVLDWCTNSLVTSNDAGEDEVQLIEVVDVTPPNVVRDPFQVSATVPGQHPNPCVSQGFLYPPLVTDNCNAWTVSIFTSVGEATYLNGVDGSSGGLIPAPGLPVGFHTILYKATDECGNTTELAVQIEVVDDVSPVAICDELTEVSLSSNGQAVVSASVFDDGSFDNCCLDFFLVRRMSDPCGIPGNTVFGPSVIFCCEDVGAGLVQVNVRVVDCYGNFNDCMVQVNVVDKLPPVTINCPAGVTIDCEEYLYDLEPALDLGDYSVLEVYGAPLFYDNCDTLISYTVSTNLNNCQVGTITRSWSTSDPSGNNPAICTQVISVEHHSNWVVEFPADITAACTDAALPPFGEPQIFFDDCELIGTAFDDQTFYVVPDACYKIIRTWTVINWCLYDDFGDNVYIEFSEDEASVDFDGDGDMDDRTFRDGVNNGTGPDGYIVYNQTIKVLDTEAPAFTVEDLDICFEGAGCATSIQLPEPDVFDCSDNISISIVTDLPGGSGLGPYPNVPPGVYTAIYEVSDHCGNIAYETISIEVEDCKKPTPYCKNGLAVEIMQTGMVDVPASILNDGSFDNCPGVLQFSYSVDVNDQVRTFTCDSIGQHDVTIWVTDANGNQDFCETFLIIQDNMDVCPGNMIIVAGLIQTEQDEPVEGVMVDVNGGEAIAMTSADGSYYFELEEGGDYTVTPMLDTLVNNGVSTLDLVIIQKEILGLDPLDSPYQRIAADANANGVISTLDMVFIKKVILLVATSFPNNTSWRFVDANYVFPQPNNPWAEPFPEIVNFNNLMINQPHTDFVAIKIGDVNGTASTTNLNVATDRHFPGQLKVATPDQTWEVGDLVDVPVFMPEQWLLGYQYTLEFDPQTLAFVDIQPGSVEEEAFGLALLPEGAITTSWNEVEAHAFQKGEVLYRLRFRALQGGSLSNHLSITSRFTPAEGYSPEGELLGIQLNFEPLEAEEEGLVLYQNIPNPFRGQTVIPFRLGKASVATLRVLDMSGRVVREVQGFYEAGLQEIRLDGFAGSGVYYYQLSTETEVATRKMVLQD